MNGLFKVIAELGLELHPDRVSALAVKIENIGSVEQFALAKSSFGPNADKNLIGRFHRAWQHNKDVSPRDVAAALRGASAAAVLRESRGTVELVWTGPSTGQVPVRHTEQVLCQVIDAVKRRLFIVSFVAYKVDSIVTALHDAVGRQVRVDLLLESSYEHNGKISYDSVGYIRKVLPSINVYVWATDKKTGLGPLSGAVHAKCAVADGEQAFITSANLTNAAMEHNMELGVLVKGGNLPTTLHHHLEALIATKLVEKVNEDSAQ